jgi:hypothetical protein
MITALEWVLDNNMTALHTDVISSSSIDETAVFSFSFADYWHCLTVGYSRSIFER